MNPALSKYSFRTFGGKRGTRFFPQKQAGIRKGGVKPAKRGRIFVISGPSGSGKTTLASRIVCDKNLKNLLTKSISFTTRPKRSGERDKKDYFFIGQEEFERGRKQKKILEWTRYLGYYYGTPKDFVERQLAKGRHLVLCLDFKGAQAMRRAYPRETVTIFVVPPSLGVLRERIENRCNKTKAEEIRKRVELAEKELAAAESYDYSLVNKDLDKTVAALKEIILWNT